MKCDPKEAVEAEADNAIELLRECELSLHMQVIQAAELRLAAARVHAMLARLQMQYDERQDALRADRNFH